MEDLVQGRGGASVGEAPSHCMSTVEDTPTVGDVTVMFPPLQADAETPRLVIGADTVVVSHVHGRV